MLTLLTGTVSDRSLEERLTAIQRTAVRSLLFSAVGLLLAGVVVTKLVTGAWPLLAGWPLLLGVALCGGTFAYHVAMSVHVCLLRERLRGANQMMESIGDTVGVLRAALPTRQQLSELLPSVDLRNRPRTAIPLVALLAALVLTSLAGGGAGRQGEPPRFT